jgi:molecular chaperone DnaJ
MASRDYYVVLGVRRGATAGEIRNAYRELAKLLHPDRSGADGTASFQELGEAYATLSDPEKRRAYDREREEPMLRGQGAVAPGTRASEPFSILHGQARYRPSREELRQRFLRNFTGIGVPKGEVVRGLNIEVILTTEEAARGVVVPVQIPTFEVCPCCRGTGHDWEYSCAYCRGQGISERERLVELQIPAVVDPATVHEISLGPLGIRNFYLRVHVFVDDRATL